MGYGTIALDGHTVAVNMIEGELVIEKMQFTDAEGTRSVDWKATAKPGTHYVKDYLVPVSKIRIRINPSS